MLRDDRAPRPTMPRTSGDYAPGVSGIMLPHCPGLRSRTFRDYAPAPTASGLPNRPVRSVLVAFPDESHVVRTSA